MPVRPSTNPIRILYVLDSVGGAASGLPRLLDALDRSRFHPIVAVAAQHPALKSLFRRRGIACRTLPRHQPVEFLHRMIRRHRIRIVQSHDSSTTGARAAYLSGVPHIWYVGGRLESTFHGPTQGLKILPVVMDRLSQAVVVPSVSLAREAFPGLQRKIHVIPNGIERVPKRFRKDPRTPQIGMAANFYPAKRHGDFLKTAVRIHRAFPETRFMLAGRCVGGSKQTQWESARYREKIARRLKKEGLEGLILLTKFDPDQWSDWFAKLDLLLIPSQEGLSKALLEAGACGVAVIAAKGGGTLEVIRAGRSGLLVPYRNPKKMAEAALSLLREPSRARKMGRALQKTVRSRFSIQRQAERFQQLYQATLIPNRR